MTLDKRPGVRPISIIEIWRWLLAKCVLKVSGSKAKDTFRNAQLSAGLDAGSEGAVHAAQSLWEDAAEIEEWRFLLVDTANTFDAGSRIATL